MKEENHKERATLDKRMDYGSFPETQLLMMIIILILCGCSKKEPTSSSNVVDSGIWIPYGTAQQKTFWLDNERVVFVTTTSFKPGPGPDALTIWTPKTGKVEQPYQASVVWCVQDGVVSFSDRDKTTEKGHSYRGTLDNIQENPPPSQDVFFDEYFDCNWTPKTPLVSPYFKKLKGDNWLEIVRKEMVSPFDYGEARYWESRDKQAKDLPVFADVQGNYHIRYNELRDAYFISPSAYYPSDAHYHSLWWLKRDGTITEEPLPVPISFIGLHPNKTKRPKGWDGLGGLEFFPLREGYLIKSNAGTSCLYLLNKQKIEKVLLGSIHGVSISPDGCQATFIHAKNTEEYLSQSKPYRTVKYINFCEGSNSK